MHCIELTAVQAVSLQYLYRAWWYCDDYKFPIRCAAIKGSTVAFPHTSCWIKGPLCVKLKAVVVSSHPTLNKKKNPLYALRLAQGAGDKDTLSGWDNPYPPERSLVPFRSHCDYNIQQTPLSKWACATDGDTQLRDEVFWGFFFYDRDTRTVIHLARRSSSGTSPSASRSSSPSPPQRHHWALLKKPKRCARVVNYRSSSALSCRRANQFGVGQQWLLRLWEVQQSCQAIILHVFVLFLPVADKVWVTASVRC